MPDFLDAIATEFAADKNERKLILERQRDRAERERSGGRSGSSSKSKRKTRYPPSSMNRSSAYRSSSSRTSSSSSSRSSSSRSRRSSSSGSRSSSHRPSGVAAPPREDDIAEEVEEDGEGMGSGHMDDGEEAGLADGYTHNEPAHPPSGAPSHRSRSHHHSSHRCKHEPSGSGSKEKKGKSSGGIKGFLGRVFDSKSKELPKRKERREKKHKDREDNRYGHIPIPPPPSHASSRRHGGSSSGDRRSHRSHRSRNVSPLTVPETEGPQRTQWFATAPHHGQHSHVSHAEPIPSVHEGASSVYEEPDFEGYPNPYQNEYDMDEYPMRQSFVYYADYISDDGIRTETVVPEDSVSRFDQPQTRHRSSGRSSRRH